MRANSSEHQLNIIMLQTKILDNQDLYELDFNLWVEAQRLALQDGRYDYLDLPNLLEEIDGLTRRDKRALKSHLRVLLTHLLKWQYQPQKRTTSWRSSIDNARLEIADILDDSPSLRNFLSDVFTSCYQVARKQASKETQLPLNTFPPDCPYALEQSLKDDD